MSRDSYPRLTTRREAEEEVYEDGEWTASFCGCLADPSSCCLTTLCPCIAVGMVAQKLDRGSTHWLTGALVWLVLQEMTTLGCIYSSHYRGKLRERFNLPSRPLPDPLVHWICWPCALCQELRELKARETTYYGFGDHDPLVTVSAPGDTDFCAVFFLEAPDTLRPSCNDFMVIQQVLEFLGKAKEAGVRRT